MADEKNLVQEQEDGDLVVIMTDEEGNEFYYREEVMIPIGNKKFAILVSIEEDTCNCGCHAEVNNDVFVARIDVDEDGEEVYVDPTDEEFDMVCEEYNKLIEEDAE